MLRHLQERNAADRLEDAIASVIAEGKDVTYDLKPKQGRNPAGTSDVADAVINKLKEDCLVAKTE
jgi:isocitrate dehydrogenase (NAD+)